MAVSERCTGCDGHDCGSSCECFRKSHLVSPECEVSKHDRFDLPPTTKDLQNEFQKFSNFF